jgi:hypothetical protein
VWYIMTTRFTGPKFIPMCNTHPASIFWLQGNLCLFTAIACISSQFTYCPHILVGDRTTMRG